MHLPVNPHLGLGAPPTGHLQRAGRERRHRRVGARPKRALVSFFAS